mmetsp:Transcript_24844/g.68479  ORF Transcript_24844/g.68479 Transcript_24844/m.68479 type:complete len:655 (+) Transcript_24844:277-2241(+)
MDFRSQLSAFQNKSSDGSNSRGNSGANSRSNNDNNYSGNRGGRGNYSNSNSNNNSSYHHNSNSNSSSNRYGSPNRGRGDGYGGDRRRNRPGEWSQNPKYHHGPPTARRRFHAPPYGSPGHGYGHGHGHGHGPPPNLDGLGDLRGLGYGIPRGFPPAPTPKEKAKKSKHLALLAIIIDDLPYEEIWKAWMQTLSSSSSSSLQGTVDDYFVSVVCHAKFPRKVASEWLRKRLLTFPPKQGRGNSFMDPVFLSRSPEWGSVEITRAMLDLLQDGLKIGNDSVSQYEDKRFCPSRFLVRSPPSFDGDTIPPVDHFLYISESCVPVVTAPEFFRKISDSSMSWVNARHRTEDDTPKNKYEDDQFAGINRRIPGQYRWKGDQWMLVSRTHASTIIGMDRPFKPAKHQLWQSFRHINASDEMFFPTALALLGDLRYTKGGVDTQKGRSRDEESSSQQADGNSSGGGAMSSSPKNAGSETNPSSSTPHGNSSAEASCPPPIKNQRIHLKPVTYTDWTEGMKNPALFSNGATDLKRVGKLARDKGCLVARKFGTHVNIPGVALEDQKITGAISIEEWAGVIREIQEGEEETETVDAPQEQAASVIPSAAAEQTEEPIESSNAEGSYGDQNNDDDAGETMLESSGGIDEEQEDDDNDDGETQLE